ncbi:MAG TPA: VOC family protein [Solirubrobacteraceae bacterium]|nr:VOC family protein [Solirubrobacteraceae bacterium]
MGRAATPLTPLPIHHVGFHVRDLRAAIETWRTVYGSGPFYVNEHVEYDECTSSGAPAMWDHSAGFAQWGALPVELQQTHDLRPVDLVRRFTADGHGAVNHIGVTADDPAAESGRLESLGFEFCMHARLGEVEFFWHDATEAFGYCIEVITAAPGLDAFFDTVSAGARDWDGSDPIRSLG